MTSWQGAWRLYQHELRHSWAGLIFSILFYAYIALIISPSMGELFQAAEDSEQIWKWLIDFFYLTILPNMGFIMNRVMFRYWHNDPYTRKLAYWRTMPIGLLSLVISRMILLLTTLLIVGTIFFTLQYFLVGGLREAMNPGQYLLFAACWWAYSLIAGSLYMFFEQAYNGKVYFIICLCSLLIYFPLLMLCWWIGFHPVSDSMQLAQNSNPIGAIVMLIAGAAAFMASGHFVKNKLGTRSLLN
ncbi:hypothetical protein [Paenibacillus spongiae]|uniref:ABC transporter permease n=1 Tax=Paenibacillus spongiae TaxID=2909671 RepID=A0ABY5S661_9BACL|nr:hypothetical protein [Paenibacillus spongiae]UVI28973.1 hypothetical protein L1F29_26555 [Paenibacillus spongiae]